MNVWHMQLHPDNAKDFPKSKVIEVLTQKKVIGLGEWDEGKNKIESFKYT